MGVGVGVTLSNPTSVSVVFLPPKHYKILRLCIEKNAKSSSNQAFIFCNYVLPGVFWCYGGPVLPGL